jgi:hypothetical protein
MLQPVYSMQQCAHSEHESVSHIQLNITVYVDTIVLSGVKVASVILGTGSSHMVVCAT